VVSKVTTSIGSSSVKSETETTCSSSSSSVKKPEVTESKVQPRYVMVITGHGDWQEDYGFVEIPPNCTFTVLGPFGSVLGDDAAVCAERSLTTKGDIHSWVKYVRSECAIQQYFDEGTIGKGYMHYLANDGLYPLTLCNSSQKMSDRQLDMHKVINAKPGFVPNYCITLDDNIGKMLPGEGVVRADREPVLLMREVGKKEMKLSELFAATARSGHDFVFAACSGSTRTTYYVAKQIASWPGCGLSTGLSRAGRELGFMEDYLDGTGTIAIKSEIRQLVYRDYGSFTVKEELAGLYAYCATLCDKTKQELMEALKTDKDVKFPALEILPLLADELRMNIVLHHADYAEFGDGDDCDYSIHQGEAGRYDDDLHVLWVWTPQSQLETTRKLYAVAVNTG
jgi:hypothetical protein